MKKIILISLFFIGTSFFTNISCINAAPLVAKPVVYLRLQSLFEPEKNEYKIIELKKIYQKREQADSLGRQKLEVYHALLSSVAQALKNGLIEKDKADFESEKLQENMRKIQDEYAVNSNEFSQEREVLYDKVAKKAEEIAKELGACAVVNPYQYYIETWIDPSYDITDRVLQEINKEYSECV